MLTNTMRFAYTRFPDTNAHHPGEGFELTLAELAEKLTCAPLINTGAKANSPAFSPGQYDNNSRQKGSQFHGASCFVADLDGQAHTGLTQQQVVDVLEFLKLNNLTYILYSSFSKDCWRLVLPLTRTVSDEEHEKLWTEVTSVFPVSIDATGKPAKRIHFLPQVSSQEAAERHQSESYLDGRLLDPDAPRLQSLAKNDKQSSGVFSGLKLSQVKVGGSFVSTLEDLTQILSTTKTKQEDLNRWGYVLAKQAAHEGQDKETFGDALWAAAVTGMNQNARPVEDPELALNTARRAVEDGYAAAAKEQASAVAAIPAGVMKAVRKLIHEGYVESAGESIARYSSDVLTPAVLTRELTELVEQSEGVVSIPDEIEKLRAAIESAQPTVWQKGLFQDKEGNWLGHDVNIDHVLQMHPDVHGRIQRDVRSIHGRSYAVETPWGTPPGEVQNPTADERAFFMWILRTLTGGKNTSAATMPAKRAGDRLTAAFDSAEAHDPFEQWLRGLKWDGVKRLDTWLSAYCGAEDNEYTRNVGRKWLIGACARAFVPGCQMDNALVFVSAEQGTGKSTAILSLLPNADSWGGVIYFEEKERPQKMYRYAIGIIEEIDKLSAKKTASELKEFVTERVRHARLPYARTESPLPRRAVMLCTSNHEDFLHDETGARRWWSVLVKKVDRESLAWDRDQLWAEAVHAYNPDGDHERWWFTKEEQDRVAAPQQTTLTKRESSPEAEYLLTVMNYCPPAMRCKLREPAITRNGRVPVTDDQVIDDKLSWVSLTQVSTILKIGEYRNDDRTVKDALKRAGLKRNKESNRYSLCGTL